VEAPKGHADNRKGQEDGVDHHVYEIGEAGGEGRLPGVGHFPELPVFTGLDHMRICRFVKVVNHIFILMFCLNFTPLFY